MSLLLAIEPDRRQAAKLSALARGPLNVELVVGDTTERAFHALGARVPDLVLTSQLLSPKDEASLADRLRELDAAGAHVQTLVIPVLGSGEGDAGERKSGGLFGRLRGKAPRGKSTEGCDPTVFGDQIAEYLERAAAERAALAAAQADLEAAWAEEPPPIASRYGEAESSWTPVVTSHQVTDADVRAEEPAASAVDDPEALFGEFAAIPIPKMAKAAAPTADASGGSPQTSRAEGGEEHAAVETFNLLERLGTPTTEAPPAVPRDAVSGVRHDEEWEEIPLEVSADGAPVDEAFAAVEDAAPPASEIVAESVDLAAFVLELETVPTSVHSEPIIPVVDLAGAMADELEAAVQALPEPEPVAEPAPVFDPAPAYETADPRATIEAAGIDGAMPPDGVEPLDAIVFEPVDAVDTDAAFAQLFATAPPAAAEPADEPFAVGAAGVEPPVTPVVDPPAAAVSGLELADFEAALQLVNASSEQASASVLEVAPPAAREPEPEPAIPPPPVVQAAWQDVLSAIRRDIGQLRTDDEAPAAQPAAPERPSFDLSNGPLVFPPRKPVAASVIEPLFKLAPAQEPQASRPAVALPLEPALDLGPHPAAETDSPIGPSDPADDVAGEPIVEALPAPFAVADLAVTARPLPEPPAAWQAEPLEPSPAPEPPAPPEAVLPVLVVDAPEPVDVRPAEKTWAEPRKSTKSKKKRKHGRHQHSHPPQLHVDAAATPSAETVDDWGFFDPQQVGFGALVGKLNEITGAGRGRESLSRW